MTTKPILRALAVAAALTFTSQAFAAGPLDVAVDGGSTELQRDVRAAIDRELSGVTAAGKITVTIGASTVEVRAAHADGRVLTRTISLPDGRGRAAEAIALLAGNLVRDQTSDLEEELKRGRRPPPPPPPAAPPAETAAAPPAPRVPYDPCRSGADGTVAAELAPGLVFPTRASDPNSVRWASLNFISGYRGTTRGFSLSVLGSHGSRGVCGVHLASIWDWGDGPVKGVQIAGVAANADSVFGYQVAPFARARHAMVGIQTGAASVAGSVSGVQVGALSVSGRMDGLQVGAVSVAGDVSGVQVGAVAVARDTEGLQLGVVNVGRKATGVQLGLVNIADESDAPIGIINVIRHGRLHVDGWLLDFGGAAAGLLHGGKYTHTIYGVGVRKGADDKAHPVFVLGIGGHVPVRERAFVDVDVLTHYVPNGQFDNSANVFQLRVIGGVKVSDALSLFAGPTANLAQLPLDADETYGVFGSKKLDWGGGASWRAWAGVAAGVRLW